MANNNRFNCGNHLNLLIIGFHVSINGKRKKVLANRTVHFKEEKRRKKGMWFTAKIWSSIHHINAIQTAIFRVFSHCAASLYYIKCPFEHQIIYSLRILFSFPAYEYLDFRMEKWSLWFSTETWIERTNKTNPVLHFKRLTMIFLPILLHDY